MDNIDNMNDRENIEKEYKKFLNDLEENLKDNPDFEYIKAKFIKLMLLFFDEIDYMREQYDEKIEKILERQSYFEDKINKVEELANGIEEEMRLNEEVEDQMITELLHPHLRNYDNDTECEVTCPYCGELFYIHVEGVEKEITCPYCDNPIEVDWNDSDNDKK